MFHLQHISIWIQYFHWKYLICIRLSKNDSQISRVTITCSIILYYLSLITQDKMNSCHEFQVRPTELTHHSDGSSCAAVIISEMPSKDCGPLPQKTKIARNGEITLIHLFA